MILKSYTVFEEALAEFTTSGSAMVFSSATTSTSDTWYVGKPEVIDELADEGHVAATKKALSRGGCGSTFNFDPGSAPSFTHPYAKYQLVMSCRWVNFDADMGRIRNPIHMV